MSRSLPQANRRGFLAASARGAAGVVVATAAGSRSYATAANERVSLALIGCGGMGSGHLAALFREQLPVELSYLCDLDPAQLDTARDKAGQQSANRPQCVEEFRRVLDDPSVDAVLVATPHHWHAPIALAALQAGKDVYLEKPASHVFREGRLLIDAAKKYGRIVQHGTQMRSSAVTQEARQVLDSGLLGPIQVAKAWNCQNRGPCESVADGQPPAGVDYDAWLGPAPARAFNERRFHRTWRQFRDYGNGDFGDDGAHDVDMARWALGVDAHPIRVTARGSSVRPAGYSEFPDNMLVAFDYPDGRMLVYEDRLFTPYGQLGVDSGNAFYGTEGYMVFSRRGFFRTYLGRKEEPGPASGKSGRVGTPVPTHLADFFHSVRTRAQPKADVEQAHLSCALIHLGEIAFRTQQVLHFDPVAEQITNSAEANALLTKEYRAPYGLPDVV